MHVAKIDRYLLTLLFLYFSTPMNKKGTLMKMIKYKG